MSDDGVPLPLVAIGAAGAFALATFFASRRANAARSPSHTTADLEPSPPAAVGAPAQSALLLDFGRPVAPEVRAVVSSGWLAQRHERIHRALDIPLPTGTPILAIDSGVVTRAVRVDRSDAGLWVAVRHPSRVTSRYIHLSRVDVHVGQTVNRGERVGLSGNTGSSRSPHLHLDLRAPSAMLPEVERVIGRPSTGWGPNMSPFGHSIPGEPWIPVDAYRDRVRRDALAAGIPLRNVHGPRNGSLAYRPVGRRGEPYPEWLQRIKGYSGVYVIREGDEVVYVGESHSARLFETLTRHFQNVRHEAQEVPMT